jgi:hypothetical protein
VKFIKTYEEFRFKEEEDTDVLDPETDTDEILIDKPVDDTLLGKSEEDTDSYVDASGVIHINNWKVY